MSHRQPEPWGGEVHLPHWLRHALRRPEPPGDTPEAGREARKPHEQPSVIENADRANVGALSALYREGRHEKPH
jgi:hypothetical protein